MFRGEINSKKKQIPLSSIPPNKSAIIKFIPKGNYKSQLLRFGIFEGQIFEVISKLPGETMVIKINRQEIALGSKLSKKILVQLL